MPCPTCGHTMSLIGETRDHRMVRHCERCGTVRVTNRYDGHVDLYRPKLVDYCRKYQASGHCVPDVWHCLGIAEATNLPADRPQPQGA